MHWKHDYTFRRIAELLWKDDHTLATTRAKGSRAADRRLQDRYDGWCVMKTLARVRKDIDNLCADAALEVR